MRSTATDPHQDDPADVNVLVYAFRREAEAHERYASWLTDVVAGADEP